MRKRKWKKRDIKSLPEGSYAPCQLKVEFEKADPGRAKELGFEPKDQWRFTFTLRAPDDPLHSHTGVVWCNDSESDKGNLFKLLASLNGGKPPKYCDPESFDDGWFRVQVTEVKEGQYRADSAYPVDAPDDDEDRPRKKRRGESDDDEDEQPRRRKRRSKQSRRRNRDDDDADDRDDDDEDVD